MLKGLMNDLELPEALAVVADLAESKGEILLSKVLNNLARYIRLHYSASPYLPWQYLTGGEIKNALDRAVDSIHAEATRQQELPIYELAEDPEVVQQLASYSITETIACPVCKATGSDVSRYPISGCERCGGSGRIVGDGELKVPLIEAARIPKPHRRKKWLGI